MGVTMVKKVQKDINSLVKFKSKDAEKLVEEKVNAKMAEHLFEQVEKFNERIAGLAVQRDELIKQVAEAICPFKPGQTIKTTKGNGVSGIKIEKYVVPPTNPGSGFTKENRWAIYGLFFSKAGEITNRHVVITEERMKSGMFGDITVQK